MNTARQIVMAIMLSLFLAAPSAQAATGQVGVIDFARILQQMPETKKAQATLKSTAAPFEKELQRMNQELQKSLAAYEKERAGMTPQAREQKEKEINLQAQGIKKYQQEKFGRGGILDKKEQELVAPIRTKLLGAIQTLSKKEGFTLVLDKQAMVYGTAEHDLTFKVMNQLNIK